MSPMIRHLYERLKEEHPATYEVLCQIDAELADLHAQGLILSRQRLALLENAYSAKHLEEVLKVPLAKLDPDGAILFGKKF